jgi:hypothetical protein
MGLIAGRFGLTLIGLDFICLAILFNLRLT